MNNTIETIRAEIERLKDLMKGLEPHSDFRKGQITGYNEILSFLGTLEEWSEEDEKTLDCVINVLDRLGYEEFCKSSRDQDNEEERFYYKEIQCLKKLKSLRPHHEPSDLDRFRAETARDILAGMLGHPKVCFNEEIHECQVKTAIEYADELIKQLKEK